LRIPRWSTNLDPWTVARELKRQIWRGERIFSLRACRPGTIDGDPVESSTSVHSRCVKRPHISCLRLLDRLLGQTDLAILTYQTSLWLQDWYNIISCESTTMLTVIIIQCNASLFTMFILPYTFAFQSSGSAGLPFHFSPLTSIHAVILIPTPN
jgi:hypothetical protein